MVAKRQGLERCFILPYIDAKGSKTDGIGRDAVIAHTAQVSLNRARPLALHVQMTVDAGRNSRLLEVSHPGAWPAVGVERRIVPQDVKWLLAAGSEPGRQFEPTLQLAHFVIDDGLLFGRRFSIADGNRSSRPADDNAADLQRIAPDRAE